MVYELLKMWGERYIFCDDAQAQSDALPVFRENMVASFAAIMEAAKLKGGDGNG